MCEPHLCPDAPEGGRCDHCPQDKLDAAQSTESGLLIRRAIELRAALNLGITIALEDILADEFYSMLLLDEERERYERERSSSTKTQ